MVSVSVVIPAYNEAKRLPSTLDGITGYFRDAPYRLVEILVVDDGSGDETADVVRRHAERCPAIRLLSNPGNRGKGYTVRHGMTEARGVEWVLFSDADLSSPIEELSKLMTAASETGAVIAIGSRALDRSLVEVHQGAFREYSGRVFNFCTRVLTGLSFRDTQCGFKLYRADAAAAVFSRQKLDGFSFDVEDLVIAKRLGLPAVEVPVRWRNVEGTKVSMGSGLKSFSDIARIRLNAMRGRYS